MDDRLAELRRQREIVAGHLRWLDQQIVRSEMGGSPDAPVAAPTPTPVSHALAPATPSPAPVASIQPGSPAGEPQAIPEVALPETDSTSIRSDVRRGCFIYVAVVTVLLAASLGVVLWISSQ